AAQIVSEPLHEPQRHLEVRYARRAQRSLWDPRRSLSREPSGQGCLRALVFTKTSVIPTHWELKPIAPLHTALKEGCRGPERAAGRLPLRQRLASLYASANSKSAAGYVGKTRSSNPLSSHSVETLPAVARYRTCTKTSGTASVT